VIWRFTIRGDTVNPAFQHPQLQHNWLIWSQIGKFSRECMILINK
jgi:hypothetical protein